ncbi:MAG: hypothetical protein K0S23_1774 [Fluviicola sp.]|nr:hypothetical protein [Fluviicola sp.]
MRISINISLFLVLFTSLPAGAQSAKELNKQLRAELAVEQQKQDSCHSVFLRSYRELDSVKESVYIKLQKLSEAARSIRETYSSVSSSLNTLKSLGRYPDMDFKELNALKDYSDFIKPIKGSLKTKERFEVVLNNENLEKAKTKEQNQLWGQKLVEYRDKAALNASGFRKNEAARIQLQSFSPQLDSILIGYQYVTEDLLPRKAQLEKELDVLRENYRLKGPEGFSFAYREAFPDIHPLPPRENGDIVMDGTIESEGDYDAVPVQKESSIPVQEPEIYEIVDEPAIFPGGYDALKKYLAENIVYPSFAKEAGISGKVFLKFVVSDKGRISNVKIMRGIPDCPECDKEAIRVVKGMPAWIPGKVKGKAVNSVFNLPVQFKL